MERAQNNIIDSMSGYIFKTQDVDPKIKGEVLFFRKVLIENKNNYETFHGYVNKLGDVWNIILSDNFKRLIKVFNTNYEEERLRAYIKQQDMINMAEQMATEDLLGDLSELGLTPSISSLTKSMKSSGLSGKVITKKPSKKKK